MRYSISNTAEYGDLTRGKRVIGPESPRRDEADPRRDPVGRVRHASGSPRTRPARRTSTACAKSTPSHQIEKVGGELRDGMDWINTEFDKG